MLKIDALKKKHVILEGLSRRNRFYFQKQTRILVHVQGCVTQLTIWGRLVITGSSLTSVTVIVMSEPAAAFCLGV